MRTLIAAALALTLASPSVAQEQCLDVVQFLEHLVETEESATIWTGKTDADVSYSLHINTETGSWSIIARYPKTPQRLTRYCVVGTGAQSKLH